jgi:hypothetical protein
MRQLFLLFACGAVALAGCGKAASVKTYPVTGTVTYNGKPLEGATVVYVPTNPDAPRVSGSTDSDGKFSLSTFVSASEILRGAPADEYKVLVTKVNVEQAAATSGPDFQNLPMEQKQAAMQKAMGAGAADPTNPEKHKPEALRPKSLVPEKYNNPKTTPLSKVVVVGNNEPHDFKLTDD